MQQFDYFYLKLKTSKSFQLQCLCRKHLAQVIATIKNNQKSNAKSYENKPHQKRTRKIAEISASFQYNKHQTFNL